MAPPGQKAGAFEAGQPFAAVLAEARRAGTGSDQILHRISLTAFGIEDLGYCPRRYAAAIAQDEVGARARSSAIAAYHHRLEAADMARKETVSLCLEAPDRGGI